VENIILLSAMHEKGIGRKREPAWISQRH
jgi:hypothetical protein